MCFVFLFVCFFCGGTGYQTHMEIVGSWHLSIMSCSMFFKESESEVSQSCLTLCDPMDCSPPGSSIHEIFQARVLEWVAISFSRGSSWPRDQTGSPALWADPLLSEPPGEPLILLITKKKKKRKKSIGLFSFLLWYKIKGLSFQFSSVPQWCPTAIQPSHPLSTPSWLLPSIFPSIRVFSNESVLIRWPKYWSFSFSISPSNEYSGLISFRLDWFDLLAVQGTLKNLLQHDSSKALILWHSAFFIVAMHSCKFKLTLTGLELFSSSHWTRLIVLSLSLHNPWPWGNQGNKKWGIY